MSYENSITNRSERGPVRDARIRSNLRKIPMTPSRSSRLYSDADLSHGDLENLRDLASDRVS